MNQKNHRVVVYVRISKDRVDQTSTETQEAEAIAFCEARGWTIVEVCRDQGRSAYKRNVKRPAFDRAMRMVETGHATLFLVWKLDRFYRGLDEFNDAWRRIRNANGELVSVTEPTYDTTSDDPIIKWAIMGFAAMAEQESRVKSHRSTSNHRKRFADGAIPNGPRPFGYDKPSKGVLTVNPKESAFIVDAATRVIKGESLRSILRSTTLTGATGKPLTPRGLSFILTCPRTAGYRKSTESGHLVRGQWTPILDDETWNAVKATLANPSRLKGNGNQLTHVLTGIVTCGKDGCGGYIGPRTWKGGYRYQCRVCGVSIEKEAAETVVRAKILELCPQSRWESLRTQGRGFDPDVVNAIQERIDELWIEQATCIDERERTRYQKALARLEDQLANAKGGEWVDLPNVANLADEWDSMPVEELRTVIRYIAPTIQLHSAKGGTLDPMARISVAA